MNTPKFLVRFTIMFIAVYFLYTYYQAMLGIVFFNDFYVVLLELCLCVFCFIQGKYHCRYMRFNACAILFCDSLTRLDNELDFMDAEMHNLIPSSILATTMILTLIMSIVHFYKVRKILR